VTEFREKGKMTSIRSYLIGMAIIGSLAASLNLLHAQTAVVGNFNNNLALVQAAAPDSIVQILADANGLELLSPGQAPRSGTFWWITASGNAVPAPCPPLDLTAPIYQLAANQFLVDQTGGAIPAIPRRFGMQAQTTGGTPVSGLEMEADTVLNLIERVQAAAASQQMGMMAGRTMSMNVSGGPVPGFEGGGGGGSGTNGFYSDSFNFHPDYGTNLWIAETNLASGYMSGVVSNTTADIQYELQYKTDLAQSDWQSAGWFTFGSEITNWTAWSVPAVSSSNLFLRVRSWQDDGSGLPLWWQQQYFGSTGVDPYGNSAGDGWNNLQKFQNGMNPNVFYTPPAPQGLVVSYNNANGGVAGNWLPSSGSVTGYTVEKADYNAGETTDFNFSGGTDGFEDTVSDVPSPWALAGNGPLINVTYKVQAHYDANNSAWSEPVNLEPNYWPLESFENAYNQFAQLAVQVVPGSQGSACLSASALPPGTAKLRITRIDSYFDFWNQDTSYDTNYDISVSSFTNGLAPLPDSWLTLPTDPYGDGYTWYVQAIDASGNPGAPAGLTYTSGGPLYENNRLTPVYFDGRQQMKDNLRFLLRAASTSGPFTFCAGFDNGWQICTWPTNYVYAGFCNSVEGQGFDPARPIFDNYFYRNFVFDPDNLTTNGILDMGCFYEYDPDILFITGYPSNRFNAEDYSTAASPVVLPSLLSTGQTTWITPDGEDGLGNVAAGAHNFYGLAYSSVEDAYLANDQLNLATFNPGASVPDGICYRQTVQPIFQAAGYYFAGSPAPEQSGFSVTNTSPPLIMGVGGQMQIYGYARLAVQNGNSGVYGYLGQYFDQACQIDGSGNVTANTTGVLSPYGNFFATEPGPVALVTMPDIDTGQRGTGTVYCVSLNVDANHDGMMDLSFGGPDATSQARPFVFWINNNFDRWLYDADDNTNYEDDVAISSPAAVSPYTGKPAPDCEYRDFSGNRIIPTTRDLEDYARLWVSGVTSNLLAALPAGGTVTLSLQQTISSNSYPYGYLLPPTIDLFAAADADGGIGYLTNETIATAQIDPIQCPYVGRLGPGQSIQLNANYFGSAWRGDHFIWCGVSGGSGQLNLTIADASGNVLAQSTTYIQIVDIKNMYERWTAGDNPKAAPMNVATNAVNDLPDPMQPPFQYASPQNTNTPYILYVHGWNMETWEKDRFAETAFKRLYWQGYQGRFGSFRWPTGFDFVGWKSVITDPDNFDNSEFQAWKSGAGLLNKLNDLNAQYPGNVYLMAHSMGNVVAGEALRLAGNDQVVNTYIAMQGAISAHCYDATTASRFSYCLQPDRYAFYWTNGAPCYFNGIAGAGTCVNFYNANDFALDKWQIDQNLKPDVGYGYDSASDTFSRGTLFTTPLHFPTNTYEIFSYADPAWSYALGAQENVGGAFNQNLQLNLFTSPYNFGPQHLYHSLQFRSDLANCSSFWDIVLRRIQLK
jgi:hypothetical protein